MIILSSPVIWDQQFFADQFYTDVTEWSMQNMIQHDAGILLQPDIYYHIDIPIFPY